MDVVHAWYDPEADALEIRLSTRPVARTVELTDLHMVDLDAEGRPVAVEILAPNDPRLEQIAAEFGLGDLLPRMRAAIETAMAPPSTSSGSLLVVLEEVTYRPQDFPVIPVVETIASESASSALAKPAEELTLN